MTVEKNNNRVIIVGGSISGLALALCLQKGGMDFLILEKGEIGPQLGASVAMHAHGSNVLAQLGVYSDVREQIYPLEGIRYYDKNAKLNGEAHWFSAISKKFGFPIAFLQRQKYIRTLYDHISDKSKVLVAKQVIDYEETQDGVIVRTADGEQYTGSIFVGADGVHSPVRNLMAKKMREREALRSDALCPLETVDNGQPGFKTHYKAIFAVSRTDEKVCPLAPGQATHVYSKGCSTIAVHGAPNELFWFLFLRVPEFRGSHAPRYNAEDAEVVIEQHRNMLMSDNFTVGDAWDARVKGDLISLEEGVVDQWSLGRGVLIGDSAHKVTINAGLGANLAIEGAVNISNLLHPFLSCNATTNEPLTTEKCDELFTQYRQRHLPRAQLIYTVSAQTTRLEAQATSLDFLLSTYVLPRLGSTVTLSRLSPVVMGAPTLDFAAKDSSRPMNENVPRSGSLSSYYYAFGAVALSFVGWYLSGSTGAEHLSWTLLSMFSQNSLVE